MLPPGSPKKGARSQVEFQNEQVAVHGTAWFTERLDLEISNCPVINVSPNLEKF